MVSEGGEEKVFITGIKAENLSGNNIYREEESL